jgi:hypothetical protein
MNTDKGMEQNDLLEIASYSIFGHDNKQVLHEVPATTCKLLQGDAEKKQSFSL